MSDQKIRIQMFSIEFFLIALCLGSGGASGIAFIALYGFATPIEWLVASSVLFLLSYGSLGVLYYRDGNGPQNKPTQKTEGSHE